ncbi:MAG: nucleotidyl transferase AbiEii/AbiGii toxin family protein [Candidatus Aenigmarchaeota archaeon]|nr:nucleotidyl transferase AbiEii/AbiGii toxin family protein [Candidatus Aenigmarchaeota archaeon]
MVRIPLILRIKRKKHRELAGLQDILIENIYEILPETVLHGGTAIWRCYSGNRFSEDIDVYLERDVKKIEDFFKKLKKLGFEIVKKRIKENSLFSVLRFNNTEIRFEAVFKKINGIIKEYETCNESLVNIYTLLPEDLIKEKVAAYTSRRKIRDLYDIFFLLRYVKEVERVKPELKKLIQKFENPADEKDLKTLILTGITPTKNDILNYIDRWIR